MKSRKTWFWLMVALSPVVIVLSVFLGEGWRNPLVLLSPEREGILTLRLWRVALGTLVGSSLSVSGVLLQAVLRNPLAEPYVLGLSAGAGLGTALCIVSGGLGLAIWMQPVSGFAGAMVSLLVVYLLARVGGRTSPHTLILAGVIWGSLCASLLMFMVSQSTAEGLHAVMWWFLGDLQVMDVKLVRAVALLTVIVFLALSYFARDINALMLGEEAAGHVGLDPERMKLLLLSMAAVLTASSVCISGLIAFVGLTVPHAVRSLVGPDHRRLLPATALCVAAFLVVVDGIGRILLFPVEVPVGVLTSLVGAPFFLLLLKGRHKEMWR